MSRAEISAAILDLDGVLLDSMSIWRDLGRRYLAKKGIAAEPRLNEILYSMSMEEGADYLKTHYDLAESIPEILDQIQEGIQDYYFHEVPAKEGAAELLAFLHRQGIPMAAATSSPRTHVERALGRVGLLPFLQEILTTGELGESKHSPLIYHRTAAVLGSRPSNTLVFEDSLYALRTAKKAGFRVVGVYDPEGETDQCSLRAESEGYLETLRHFPQVWEEIFSTGETE